MANITVNMTNITTTAAPPNLVGYPGVMLLGSTTFIMALFYMANAHVKVVKENTWSVLTAAVSIFCAVMTNTVVNFIINFVFGLDGDGVKEATMGDIISAILQVLGYWVVVTILLIVFRASSLRLKGYGTIGGHMMGFASIHLWGQVCSLNPFRTSPWWIIPVVYLMYIAFQAVFSAFFHGAGQAVAKGLGLKSDDLDRWVDQSKDTGTDFMCLGGAFILTTWIKFLVFGQYDPALTDAVAQREVSQMVTLGMIAIGLLILGGILTVVAHFVKACPTMLSMLTTMVSDSAAMCLLDVFNWNLLPGAPTDLIGKLNIAFQLSMIAIGFIIIIAIIDHFNDNVQSVLRGAYAGLALAVGSSWEKTFDAAVDSLDAFGYSEGKKTLITLLLLCIVFPAWLVYILPKGDGELRKVYKKKSPPVWAACCDCDPCDDEDSDYDDIGELE